MLNPSRKMFLLTLLLGVTLPLLVAQKDDGLVLRPHPPAAPKKPTTAALRVSCDLACRWSLDGEDQGTISANGTTSMTVTRTQHLLIVSTLDKADTVRKMVDVTNTGQTVALIELQPVRDRRMAEAQLRQAAQQLQQQQTPEPQAQPRPQPPADESSAQVWVDYSTGLTWTRRDNKKTVGWNEANDYCRSLRLLGYSDWRLPEIQELTPLYDANSKMPDYESGSTFIYHQRSEIGLSFGWQWSNTPGSSSNTYHIYDFSGSGDATLPPNLNGRALCVRRTTH